LNKPISREKELITALPKAATASLAKKGQNGIVPPVGGEISRKALTRIAKTVKDYFFWAVSSAGRAADF
jgi:hypothetical protein